MKRPNHCIVIGYEAPWSAKMSNKKVIAYISSATDLNEFWGEYGGHVKELGKKKKKGDEVAVTGIIFRNMWEDVNSQVRGFITGSF